MARVAKRILLIGWDGADWRFASPLLEQGHMPNLQKLIETGAMGNLTTLQPVLSPILWTSIATGKLGDAHGILGFAEPDAESGGIRPVRSTSRQCKALWNILSEHNLNVGVIHWLASHPAEVVNGVYVSEQFWAPLVRSMKDTDNLSSLYPPELIEDLQEILIGPNDVTPRQLYPFINIADEAVKQDKRANELAVLLSRAATTQSIATLLMQTEDWDFMAVYFEAIDRFAHSFMEYHPPQRPEVSDEDFERYQHVMNGCYRFHDMMLGRLMELAGEDTLIMLVSDHGFRSDQLRPEGSASTQEQPVAWHSEHGLIAVSGGGIKPDELIFGASLLDIAPTILAALGIAVPQDMPGQVLAQIWPAGELTWETVPTYEDGKPVETVEGPGVVESPDANVRMLQRLIDLGYLQDAKLESVLAQREQTLATIYSNSNRHELAAQIFEHMLTNNPQQYEIHLLLARILLKMGQTERAHELAREILKVHPDGPRAHLLIARALMLENDVEGALEHFQKAEEIEINQPNFHNQLGYLHLQRKAWEDAERAFNRVIELDPYIASAHNGLAVALREQKRFEEAIDEHMRAVSLLHHQPEAHFQLGVTLAQTGHVEWAIRALETTLQLDPEDARAHRLLSKIYHWVMPDAERSIYHEAQAAKIEGTGTET